ncbi:MAG: radical SAM protein [Undibacterium sp.]|nr:radical SAM protein [Opitutaceae bacterium]
MIASPTLPTTVPAPAPAPDAAEPVSPPPARRSLQERLAEIGFKLFDAALMDSFLPPDEPRQRPGADIRGAVRYLHRELREFGPIRNQLVGVETMVRAVPQQRALLVVWAELLEITGNKKEAAAKARQALAHFYDDVYTQTLFMRCAGQENFHAKAQDRFCAHPFENFEIYSDGAVFPCNCTQVPFPIGNAHKQDAKAIWKSPRAEAVRASILDGSFRFCSPMTCYKRFNLPKRSEHPEEFARLQKIGTGGAEPPKHLNLSYDLSCNLSCPSCRNGRIMAGGDQRQKLEHVRDTVVLPLLEDKKAETVYITGSGDAFGSPHFRGILKQLCDPKFAHVRITLGTNGQLITPRLWREFTPLHARFRDITVSIDGAIPETHERLRRGSTWARLQESMGILRDARRSGAISLLMVNMVVQRDNFMEMRPLLALCKAWAVDGIRFYRVRQWGNQMPDLFMASDVVNPLNPRHADLLAELAHPDFDDPIVDHYDMYELIARAQTARRERAAQSPDPAPAADAVSTHLLTS